MDPAVALDRDGRPHVAVTSRYDGGPSSGGAAISYCRGGEGGFLPLRTILPDGNGRKPRIAVDPAGHAVIVFENRLQNEDRLRRVQCLSIAPDGTASTIAVLGQDNPGGLVVDDRGTRHITWRTPQAEKGLRYTAVAANGEVSAPLAITPPAGDFSNIALAPADASLHVVGQAAGAGGIYYVVRTADGQWREAQTFPFPEATRVENADLVNPAIAVDAAGCCYVTFTGERMLPYYFVIDEHGEARPPQRVDPDGGPTGGKYRNPQLASDPRRGVWIVWESNGAVYLRKLDAGCH